MDQDAGGVCLSNGNVRQAVERLMASRGGVVWPQLLPGKMRGGFEWHTMSRTGDTPVRRHVYVPTTAAGPTKPNVTPGRTKTGEGPLGVGEDTSSDALRSLLPSGFSIMEDRLLCRWDHLARNK